MRYLAGIIQFAIRKTTTMNDVFPYILSVLGISALFVIGRGLWWGWGLALINECLWVFFAIATHQYGFLVGAFVYGTMNLYNAVRWFRKHPFRMPSDALGSVLSDEDIGGTSK